MGCSQCKIMLCYLVGINLIAFVVYGVDKWKAKHKKWRVPEHTLLLLAFVGGCVGAAVGMGLFHHKTRKFKFRLCIPLALVLWLGLLAWAGYRMALW